MTENYQFQTYVHHVLTEARAYVGNGWTQAQLSDAPFPFDCPMDDREAAACSCFCPMGAIKQATHDMLAAPEYAEMTGREKDWRSEHYEQGGFAALAESIFGKGKVDYGCDGMVDDGDGNLILWDYVIAEWNDDPGRQHHEVMGAFDTAIAAVKGVLKGMEIEAGRAT